MLFQWQPELSVGVPIVDAQHQEIVRRINNLLEATRQGKGRAEVAQTLEFLNQYVVQHFAAEEMLMIRSAYPEYAAHRQTHLDFLNQVLQLKLKLDREGPTSALVIAVQHQVVSWLRSHIQQEDRKLAAFIQARTPALT